MPLQPGDMQNDPEMDSNETEDPQEESQDQTPDMAEVPASLFGDKPPQAGDKVTLEVRSVDEQSGTVTVCKPYQEKKQLGVKAMAAEFD